MRKVCHVTSAHPPEDGRIFARACISTAKAGFDTYLVERGNSYLKNKVNIIGIGEPRFPNRAYRMTVFSYKAYKKAISLDADIYHLHDPELLLYVPLFKVKRKKVIFDSHENTLHQIEEKEWIPSPLRLIISRLYYLFAKTVMGMADGLISVSPEIVEELKKINPNTIMITNYPIVENNLSSISDSDSKIFKLCYTGGLSNQWNHELICQAISSINSLEYHICGKADSKYIEKLNQISRNKVVYHGSVSMKEAREVQRTSDLGVALLLPSNNTNGKHGTLGNTKLFEYMDSSIPVLCTDFELWRDIINKYKCGLCVDPFSVDAVRKGIIYFMDNPNESLKMGKNGKIATLNEFNWNTQSKKLIQFYRELETK